jgi:stage II sporulation protein AB (anti-sigma F factor)
MKITKIVNELKISFPALSCNESISRMCVTAFLASLDPSVNEIAEIKTAVSEAVTNSVVHAYRDVPDGIIKLHIKASADRTVTVRITDCGCGIADVDKAMEPLYTSAPEEERAGLGFAVMESFTDSVKVKSSAGRGTTVTLVRKLSSTIHKSGSERNSEE